ncbi:hypothetical protein F5Y04DRAFT_290421 [Hypomontagnella monticulosa]|nr:hypothetical protein F5Y04DRAFT_290421 [Hypomontagnella monticulosa]
MKGFLLVAALLCTAIAVIPVSVFSTTPYTCNAIDGVDISFAPSEESLHPSIHANFPTIRMQETVPAHGNPGGDGTVGCTAAVEFTDFLTNVRFAISNVTWRNGHLNVTKNANFYSLKSKVEFSVKRLQNYYPLKCPLVKDFSSAVLLDLNVNPGIGTEGYLGEFEHIETNPKPVWSTCFGGYGSNTTKIEFSIQADTKGRANSLPGWSMDFGLVWEKCYPPADYNWGQRIIRDWESCTYRESNQTCIKTLR